MPRSQTSAPCSGDALILPQSTHSTACPRRPRSHVMRAVLTELLSQQSQGHGGPAARTARTASGGHLTCHQGGSRGWQERGAWAGTSEQGSVTSTLATKAGHPDSWGICCLPSLSAGPGWGGDLLGTVLGPAWVTLLLTDGSPRQMTLVAPPKGDASGPLRLQNSSRQAAQARSRRRLLSQMRADPGAGEQSRPTRTPVSVGPPPASSGLSPGHLSFSHLSWHPQTFSVLLHAHLSPTPARWVPGCARPVACPWPSLPGLQASTPALPRGHCLPLPPKPLKSGVPCPCQGTCIRGETEGPSRPSSASREPICLEWLSARTCMEDRNSPARERIGVKLGEYLEQLNTTVLTKRVCHVHVFL